MNPATPRILLVEDDPASAAFLADAASALPARVDAAGSIAEALQLAYTQAYSLALVDANLPDGRGETLLPGLRIPALAHTADSDGATRDRLLAAGFIEVLVKPLAAVELLRALRRHLPQAARSASWDDAAALAALGGQQAHVEAMRALFLQELPGQRGRITAAFDADDEAAMRAELHRLAASCGFVGAARLADAVRGLQANPRDAAALREFLSAAEAL